MANLAPNKKYDRRRVKEYIVKSYEFRHEAFISLLFDEGDTGDNSLHKIFKDILQRRQPFENTIEDLIASAENLNKYNELVTILQRRNPRFEYELTNSSISSPATKPTFDTTSQNNKQWAKNSQPRGYSSTNQQEPTNYPQIEKLHQDIEQLEQDISSLGEIDALLEDVRKRIGDLLLNTKVKYRMMHDERAVAANRSNVFQRNQETSFLPRKQRVSFSSPSSWRESPYAKSN